MQDARGFYANRCVMRYIEQGMAMLADGYLPALIENGARIAGMPVGPLSLQDEVAIDLGWKIVQQTKKDMGDAYVEGPTDAILGKMMELERHGRKNAKGFYDYPEGGKKRLWPELSQFAKKGVLAEDKQPSVDLIRDRILYAQALEAARTVEAGIVTDPREADVGSILAFGFAMGRTGRTTVDAARTINRQYERIGSLMKELLKDYQQLLNETSLLMTIQSKLQ